jgi:hypothetical protein
MESMDESVEGFIPFIPLPPTDTLSQAQVRKSPPLSVDEAQTSE